MDIIQGYRDLINPQLIVTINELQFGKEELGKGEFGIVYKGTLKKPNEDPVMVAVKAIKEADASDKTQIENLMLEAVTMQ